MAVFTSVNTQPHTQVCHPEISSMLSLISWTLSFVRTGYVMCLIHDRVLCAVHSLEEVYPEIPQIEGSHIGELSRLSTSTLLIIFLK